MSMIAYGSQVLQEAADIARKIVKREATRIRWATVASTDPLLIRYDGEDDPSIVPPQTVAEVAVGQRVAVAKYRGQALVLGGANPGGSLLAARRGMRSTSYTLERGQDDFDPGPVIYNYGLTESSNGFRVPVAGLYRISGGIRLSTEASAAVQVRLWSTGSHRHAVQSGRFYINASTEAILSANDEVHLQLYNNNSSSVSVEPLSGFDVPYLAVSLMRSL